jgi:hypothetical protein
MRHYLVVESLCHIVHLVLSDDRHTRVALFRLDWDKRAWVPERVGDDRVLLLSDDRCWATSYCWATTVSCY